MSATQRFFPSRILRAFFVWPVILAWRVVTWAANAIGILMALLLGFACLAVGILLCYTFIGFFIGFPLAVLGFLLMLRALY